MKIFSASQSEVRSLHGTHADRRPDQEPSVFGHEHARCKITLEIDKRGEMAFAWKNQKGWEEIKQIKIWSWRIRFRQFQETDHLA